MINTFGAETIFRDFRWSIGSVLLRTQGMSSLEHKECPASNTRNVLLGTHGMFCFDHKECLASNTRNVLFQTQRMFCLEHKECSASNTKNVLLRTQRMFCLKHTEHLKNERLFRDGARHRCCPLMSSRLVLAPAARHRIQQYVWLQCNVEPVSKCVWHRDLQMSSKQ